MCEGANAKSEANEAALPKDWWKQENVARNLHLWFRKHTIALSIGYTLDDKPSCSFSTGFLVCYRDQFMWLTAGHVLEEIEKLLKSDVHRIHSVAWIDNKHSTSINKIPFDYERLKNFKVNNKKYDVGIVIFGDLDLAAIYQNPGNVWLSGEIWSEDHLPNPEGFYLVGYPTETAETKESYDETKGYFKYDTHLVCIPVERIEPKKPEKIEDFWDHPGWFYGKVVSITKDNGTILESIKGMSGGPIISVEGDPQGEIRYLPCAIQSGWLPQSKMLCGTPVDRIGRLIDQFLEAREGEV